MSEFIMLTRVLSDPVEEDRRSYFEESEERDMKGHYVEVAIRKDQVRSVNARRGRKPGSRITFIGGGGFPVTEQVSDVLIKLGAGALLTVRSVPSIEAPAVSQEAN